MNTLLSLMVIKNSPYFYPFAFLGVGCSLYILLTAKKISPSILFLSFISLFGCLYNNLYDIDNHFFVITFWSWLVFLCALRPHEFNKLIKKQAGFLISFTMLAASFQKFMSEDYMNGSFFYLNFLVDERLLNLYEYLIPSYRPKLIQNLIQMENLKAPDSMVFEALPPVLEGLSRITTATVLLFELLVGILFLLPFKAIKNFRNILLCTFMVGVYSIYDNLSTFYFTLLVLGITQLDSDQNKWKKTYGLLSLHSLYLYCS